MRFKHKRKQLMPITLLLILCVSIGYAFLSSVLNFSGGASVKGNNFDVHFENIKVSNDSVEVPAENAATITNPTEVAFMATLNEPGDKYEFTLDIVNSGTIDAMIGDMGGDVLTAEQKRILDYSITYKDGQPVNPMDGIKANTTILIKISIKFKTDLTADDINSATGTSAAITQELDYVQADERANFIVATQPPTMKNLGYSKTENTSYLEKHLGYNYFQIKKIVLSDSINIPEGVTSWDVSEAENGSVMAYVLPHESDYNMYDLHIEGDGGISAPTNSSCLFMFGNTSHHPFSSNYTITGLENLNTSKVEDMSYMFGSCSNVMSMDFSNFDTSNVTNMSSIFFYCTDALNIDLTILDTSNVTNMRGMFYGCSGLTSLDLSPLNTSKVVDISYMFFKCSGLTNLDLGSLDTKNVTDMSYMFNYSTNLSSVNLSSLDTSNVTSMFSMFRGCSKLTSLDLSNFDTSNVTYMSEMFYMCEQLTSLDFSSFDTSKVTSMQSMLEGCSSLTSVDLSGFDTSNVKNTASMFRNCGSLTTLNLSNFDTRKVTNMSFMFYGCKGLSVLDLSKAIFDQVTTYNYMFKSVTNGVNIKVKDDTAKAFIETRLSDSSVTGTVEIASA